MRTFIKFISAGIFIISAVWIFSYICLLLAHAIIYAISHIGWTLLWLILAFSISIFVYIMACEPDSLTEHK
jgi:hypothetical protein